ncbi:uncharacterized protein C8R40DRAFT_230702 [Lentinula edodes]|uniref:uncharacterized protein n=1 Tax=Lentinula edodes TaxID=5353 RepID=UPI001E8DE942|nr:uncharacterized protein C8R40DRAFT_230702 [Lentinula edodes]KAH7874820.1 hypothetical protein C8R40DRAFT_230702 [Lentinula edodes]
MSSFSLFLAFLVVFSSSVIQLHGRPVKSLTTAELLTNAQLAQQLNAAFQSLSSGDACTSGEVACINGEAAECSGTKWKTTACIATQSCFAVPSVTKANDAVLRCTSQRSAESIIAASGASGGLTGSNSTSTSTSSNSTSTASSSTNSTSASASASSSVVSASSTSTSSFSTLTISRIQQVQARVLLQCAQYTV